MKFVITIEAPDGSTINVNGGTPVVSAPTAAPAVASGAAPVCPKHGAEKVKPSKYGGFYCTATDDSTEKGYCDWKQR